MQKDEVLRALREIGLVPVLRAESVEQALALADRRLRRAGLPSSKSR
jgi:2-keto-3-deoxy-6-phosphogluconate aldolase